jgi:ketosteroid isomerase-like protein
MRTMLALAAPLLIAASPAQKDWKQRALAAAAPFIDEANDEWARAIVRGDAAVMAAPYDTNGVLIAPDGAAIHGKAAVRAMYAKRPTSAKVLKATIKSEGRAAADPDDVYEWGRAVMTLQRSGKTRRASGRYLTVWHRSGKRWVITRNIAF